MSSFENGYPILQRAESFFQIIFFFVTCLDSIDDWLSEFRQLSINLVGARFGYFYLSLDPLSLVEFFLIFLQPVFPSGGFDCSLVLLAPFWDSPSS
jgi:hypothetical protein